LLHKEYKKRGHVVGMNLARGEGMGRLNRDLEKIAKLNVIIMERPNKFISEGRRE
jgi:hypothetical protein